MSPAEKKLENVKNDGGEILPNFDFINELYANESGAARCGGDKKNGGSRPVSNSAKCTSDTIPSSEYDEDDDEDFISEYNF